MNRTLTPYISKYIGGRRRRGEISSTTASDLRYRLAKLDRSFGGRALNTFGPAAIDRYLETIGGLAPATRREYLSTVRGFCRWLSTQPGAPSGDPTSHVPCIHQPRRAPVTLTPHEVARLLLAAPGLRSRAVVWLMVGCGARCVEVARLRVEDYDPKGRSIRLVGKAGHERVIPVPAAAAAAIDAYLDECGRVAGPLIRSELHPSRGVSPRTLSHYMRRWMRAAGVKTRALDGRSAHGLRRTAGSDVMDRSGNIRVVQAMLGHADIETTARYYLRQVTMDQMRDAMEGRSYDGGDEDEAA